MRLSASKTFHIYEIVNVKLLRDIARPFFRTNSFKETESYLYNINVYSHMFTFFDDVYLAEVF